MEAGALIGRRGSRTHDIQLGNGVVSENSAVAFSGSGSTTSPCRSHVAVALRAELRPELDVDSAAITPRGATAVPLSRARSDPLLAAKCGHKADIVTAFGRVWPQLAAFGRFRVPRGGGLRSRRSWVRIPPGVPVFSDEFGPFYRVAFRKRRAVPVMCHLHAPQFAAKGGQMRTATGLETVHALVISLSCPLSGGPPLVDAPCFRASRSEDSRSVRKLGRSVFCLGRDLDPAPRIRACGSWGRVPAGTRHQVGRDHAARR